LIKRKNLMEVLNKDGFIYTCTTTNTTGVV